jgi:hypothetical protein
MSSRSDAWSTKSSVFIGDTSLQFAAQPTACANALAVVGPMDMGTWCLAQQAEDRSSPRGNCSIVPDAPRAVKSHDPPRSQNVLAG